MLSCPYLIRMSLLRVRRLALPLAVLIALSGPASVHAQTRRPMSLAGLLSIPRISDVQLSPDGRFVTYMLSRADWKVDQLVPHIWRQAVSGGAPVQLTNGSGNGERFARWSPDGRSILYWAGGQLWLMAADGSGARQLTRHATPVMGPPPGMAIAGPSWAPDGSAVYFVARDVSRTPAGGQRPSPLITFEETDITQQHVWKVDVASGAETKLTDGNWSVLPGIRVSRDGRHIVLLRAPTALTIDHYRSNIWVLDLESGRVREVTNNGIYETEAELSPDNSEILFIADANEDLDVYYGASVFVVPAAGGRPRLAAPRLPYTVEQAAWTPDGRGILAVANMGVHSEVVRIDRATGDVKALTDGRHAVQGWSVVPSANRMSFMLDEPTRLGDAWTLPIEGGTPTRVTGIYDTLTSDFAFPRQERVSWKGADGIAIEGVLFYPIDYQQGRRYPVIVQLHGGPPLSDKFGYGAGVIFNYVPVLAGKGYAVFRPNYRGSAGYGTAFIRDIIGHYFNNMHLDVIAGVDALVAQGIADPDRLAVAGWSAGAHLVNKLVTVTDRFKAASSGAGVANWISMMAQTDALTRRESWFGGSPWEKNAPIDLYVKQSPITDISRAKTPTLLFAGERDSRVPMAQALEMYRGLQDNNVPTKLVIGKDEEHDWTGGPLRQQFEKANTELAWYEKYVMSRDYRPEPYPGDAPPAP